ncbi:MAG TPA: hypothetical protein VMC86_03330 [Gemmatimonadales bacterium]|nr:hypothetical protein [Gemmatimonadales bacterium]
MAVSTAGCNKLKGMFGKKEPPPVVPHHAQPAPQTQPAATPPPAAPAPKVAVKPVQDQSYDSPDTGTIAPGMTESQVYTLWGAPTAVRHAGTRTYLFFQNGCGRSCGTADVVTLDNGQVVDAIVRWPGHGYSGQSSSPKGGRAAPADTTPAATPAAAPAPAVTPAPAPTPVMPADTTKKDTTMVKKDTTMVKDTTMTKKDTTMAKPDSMAKDSTKQKPDSTH